MVDVQTLSRDTVRRIAETEAGRTGVPREEIERKLLEDRWEVSVDVSCCAVPIHRNYG